jgi:hypothetical protein
LIAGLICENHSEDREYQSPSHLLSDIRDAALEKIFEEEQPKPFVVCGTT